MKSRLPATPLEALSISGALRFIVKTIHTMADIFGFWKHPSKKAAADFEDMSLVDKIYWGYKSKNPVVHAEKGTQLKSHFSNRQPSIELPDGFEKKQSLTFAAAGDLIKVEGLENSRDTLYDDISPLIFDKDVSYANLESQLTGQDMSDYVFSDKETPPLCCTAEQYEALKRYKDRQFTVMNLSCNHTLDMGLEGLETTLAQLEKDGILDLGTNRNPGEQKKARVIEKNGIKIGFVSATYGLNGKEVPEGKEYMVNVVKFHPKGDSGQAADLSLLNRQMEDCKQQGCDIVVASLHWGYEYEFFPRQHQVDIAHAIIEAGADVIIGHHTHVLQPVEFYRTQRDPDRTGVIVYSLGNLTSSFSAPHIVLSGILNLTFAKGTVKGEEKTVVQEAGVVPVVQRDLMEGDEPKIRIEQLETFLNQQGTGEDRDRHAYNDAVKKYSELVL
ncbi:MAG: CapA family protein [bacterium]|nr:CapA family protein [bacterium]